jgi:hypothetical protein
MLPIFYTLYEHHYLDSYAVSFFLLHLHAADARPTILWLFSDDHAVQATGSYGGRGFSSNCFA